MTLMIQYSAALLIGFMFFFHPLMLVMILIMQTLPIIVMISYAQETNWLSYMLFLIYLGGLLIIFTYLSALIPNEIFVLKPMMLIMISLILFTNKFQAMSSHSEDLNQLSMFALMNMSSIIPMMITYLLAALCVSMFLCSNMKTPLKQQMN